MDLADNALQRFALGALGYRAVSWRLGIAYLSDSFAARARLLREAIDGNQRAMAQAMDSLSTSMRERERFAYERFERTLANAYVRIAVFAVVMVSLCVLIGLAHAGGLVRDLAALVTYVNDSVS